MENKSTVCAVISAAMVVVLLYMTFRYDKWGAAWGGVPVWLIGICLAVVVAVVFQRFEWFQYPDWPVSTGLLVIIVSGFIVSAYLGIYFTEPFSSNQDFGQAEYGSHIGYDYRYTRAGGWYFDTYGIEGIFASDSDDNSSSSSSSSTSKDSGEAIILVFLVALVLLLVLGSAVIPHFWVVSLLILLAISLIILNRERQLEESMRHRRRYSYR